MPVDLVGQTIENRVEYRRIDAKQCLHDAAVLEQSVQVQAQHIARGVLPRQSLPHHRVRMLTGWGHGRMLRGLAVVDFIALHRQA